MNISVDSGEFLRHLEKYNCPIIKICIILLMKTKPRRKSNSKSNKTKKADCQFWTVLWSRFREMVFVILKLGELSWEKNENKLYKTLKPCLRATVEIFLFLILNLTFRWTLNWLWKLSGTVKKKKMFSDIPLTNYKIIFIHLNRVDGIREYRRKILIKVASCNPQNYKLIFFFKIVWNSTVDRINIKWEIRDFSFGSSISNWHVQKIRNDCILDN